MFFNQLGMFHWMFQLLIVKKKWLGILTQGSVVIITGSSPELINSHLLLLSIVCVQISGVILCFKNCSHWLLKWNNRFTIVALVFSILILSFIGGIDNICCIRLERVTIIAKCFVFICCFLDEIWKVVL